MVSDDDGRNWETRSSRDLRDLRDLVVSPADPETLLATTAAGPMRSGDGGRTWAQPPGAPTLTVLAWASPESLYGAAPSGQLWHSADAGTTWTPCGAVTGEPEALLLDRRDGLATVYVAVGAGHPRQHRRRVHLHRPVRGVAGTDGVAVIALPSWY